MAFQPGIDSKFRFILVAAKRAHQLSDGGKARVQSESNKITVVAQREVRSGLVPFKVCDRLNPGLPIEVRPHLA